MYISWFFHIIRVYYILYSLFYAMYVYSILFLLLYVYITFSICYTIVFFIYNCFFLLVYISLYIDILEQVQQASHFEGDIIQMLAYMRVCIYLWSCAVSIYYGRFVMTSCHIWQCPLSAQCPLYNRFVYMISFCLWRFWCVFIWFLLR